jgi:hypothetical protein
MLDHSHTVATVLMFNSLGRGGSLWLSYRSICCNKFRYANANTF